MPDAMPLAEQQRRAARAMAVPLNRHIGLQLIDADEPSAGAGLIVGEQIDNGLGGAHAGAIEVLAEVAALLATLPSLGDDEHAVSHMSAFQLIGVAAQGESVQGRGRLDRRTRRLAFASVEVTSAGVLVARAQVTKSVITARFA